MLASEIAGYVTVAFVAAFCISTFILLLTRPCTVGICDKCGMKGCIVHHASMAFVVTMFGTMGSAVTTAVLVTLGM